MKILAQYSNVSACSITDNIYKNISARKHTYIVLELDRAILEYKRQNDKLAVPCYCTVTMWNHLYGIKLKQHNFEIYQYASLCLTLNTVETSSLRNN